MEQKISQRYQKNLVTVAMGFRTEEDIKKNGLYIFRKKDNKELIKYINSLLKKNKSILALRVKQTGYRSEHININSEEDLNNFIKNLDNIFEEESEVWIVSSSVIECWRGRIYISSNESNISIEMAYSYDDHILDHIGLESKEPYIYSKASGNNINILKTNLNESKITEAVSIIQDILNKYSKIFKHVKEDLNYIGINGISIDVRVNDGYDFHDFDVDYSNVEKVIKYYVSQLNNSINPRS